MSEFEEAAEVGKDILREEAAEAPSENMPRWIVLTALSTLVMALFSAVGALMAGITANEALLGRTTEILEAVNRDRDQLEVEILATKHDILSALNQPVDDGERKLVSQIREATKEIAEDELVVSEVMHKHETFAIGVTLLSIAITLSGMAVVTRRPPIWHVGLVIGVVGAGFVSRALWLVTTG